jgi:hypothetical protein
MAKSVTSTENIIFRPAPHYTLMHPYSMLRSMHAWQQELPAPQHIGRILVLTIDRYWLHK